MGVQGTAPWYVWTVVIVAYFLVMMWGAVYGPEDSGSYVSCSDTGGVMDCYGNSDPPAGAGGYVPDGYGGATVSYIRPR